MYTFSRLLFHACLRLIIPALLALAVLPAAAQTVSPSEDAPIKVGVHTSPPFVMQQGESYTGMAIDLWEDLARRLQLDYTYTPMSSLRELVDGLGAGEIDVVATNLTITQARAERIDFTHPWFDAGLRLMVPGQSRNSVWDILTGLRNSGHLRAYAWLAGIVLLATVGLTLFDRRFDKNFPRRWREGLAESFYAVMSVAVSGKAPSRAHLFGWVGRILQAFWLICGVALVAYVTSSVTSVMTTLSLTNQITGLEDLSGKRVGVFDGSVAETYAIETGLSRRVYADIDTAVAGLNRGEVAAIIADAPVLEYYELHQPEAGVEVVGPIFEPDKYGFGLALNSELTRPLTLELLGLHEAEQVEQLRTRYLGER